MCNAYSAPGEPGPSYKQTNKQSFSNMSATFGARKSGKRHERALCKLFFQISLIPTAFLSLSGHLIIQSARNLLPGSISHFSELLLFNQASYPQNLTCCLYIRPLGVTSTPTKVSMCFRRESGQSNVKLVKIGKKQYLGFSVDVKDA